MAVGYTAKQAERLHHRIDVQASKAADALTALTRLVPDHEVYTAHEHENLLSIAASLHAVVDRRRRRA